MINAETAYKNVNSHYCPWGQTIPFVVKNSSTFSKVSEIIIHPTLHFRDGKEAIGKSLIKALKPHGENKKTVMDALEVAYEKSRIFQNELLAAGKSAIEILINTGEIGIVLIGRAYNVNDRGMTLDIGNKIRDYYGINIIPMDFLPLDSIDISDINSNMYWNYGRKIIAAAKIVGKHPNLHIIYLTNFKCGPDSYIKHYITKASGKPFLTLQFDDHSNDAGFMTRCEAYLDSKGALRRWRRDNKQVEARRQVEVV
jgi:predicted nucleotide-binding protein (sugar kinase/HSP70/actin superfamily)